MRWVEEKNATALAEVLASDVAARLDEEIKNTGAASLVVSGGSTPLPFFKALSDKDISWAKVKITLADERWVPYSSDDSNERFVKENLMVGKAADARFQSLYLDGLDAEAALSKLQTTFNTVLRPYTVVILGMGGDGHTASLFPDTDGLANAMDLTNGDALAVMRPASVSQVRISMTRSALFDTENLIVHITGEQKKQLLSEQLAQTEPTLPIGQFFKDEPVAVTVYWSP